MPQLGDSLSVTQNFIRNETAAEKKNKIFTNKQNDQKLATLWKALACLLSADQNERAQWRGRQQ